MIRILSRTALGLSVALTGVLSGQEAEAHNVAYHHSSVPIQPNVPPTVTPFCDGKYDDIARTLNRQDIVGRVNLYRANVGLSKLQTTRLEGGFVDRGYYTRADTRIRDALLLLERSQSHLSQKAEADHLLALDIATPSGGKLDWWLTEDINNPKEEVYNCRHWINAPIKDVCEKTPNAKTIRQSAAFDWLMSDHQLQWAEWDWSFNGRQHQETRNIFSHIDHQATIRPGINIWMAQYEFHKTLAHELPSEIAQRAQSGVVDVLTCEASPAEYAILAKGDLGLPFDHLPIALAERRTQRDIRTLTIETVNRGQGLDLTYHAALNQLTDRLRDKNWAAGLRILSGPDLQTVLTISAEAVRHEHLYFALPAAQIPETYPGMQLAHALTEDDMDLGMKVAARVRDSKLLGLKKEITQLEDNIKRNEGTGYAHYVNHLKAELSRKESRYKAYKDKNVLGTDLPEDVKVALTVLLGDASHNLETHHRDIYKEQTSAEFLDLYLRRLLFSGIGTRPWRWASYRWAPHHSHKDTENSVASSLLSLRKNDGTPEVGFAALVHWDKLAEMGDEKRLTRTIALTVFEWIDKASTEDRTRHADLMAQALYDIIRMCRHEDAGDLNGAPVQKRAFERLHKYYGKSDQAKRTKYWWGSRGRHGNLPL